MVDFILENLLGPVIAAVLTALYLRGVAAPGEVNRHDSQVADLNEDLRRWVRDQNRIVGEKADEVIGLIASHGGIDALEQKVLGSGKPVKLNIGGAFAKARTEALHQYRDEASRKLRQFRDIGDLEGWTHRLARRWGLRPAPQLALPEDCRQILNQWRAPVVDSKDPDNPTPVEDVSAPELEPDLVPLETGTGARWRTAI